MALRPDRVRGIADVAQLYLSGTKAQADRSDSSTGANGPVLRLSEPVAVSAEDGLLPVSAVVWEHLGPSGAHGVHAYAEHLARAGRRVALLTADMGGVALRVLQAADRGLPEALQNGRFKNRLGDPAQLAGLGGLVDCLVVRVSGAAADSLIDCATDVCVLTGCDVEGLTKGYQAIKALTVRDRSRPLSLFAVNAGVTEQAQAAVTKLTDMASRFLGCQVQCQGWALQDGTVRAHLLEHHVSSEPNWLALWLSGLADFVARCSQVRDGEGPAVAAADPEPEVRVADVVRAVPVEPARAARLDTDRIDTDHGAMAGSVETLEPVAAPIRSAVALYDFVCERIGLSAECGLVLEPPGACGEALLRVMVGADGSRTVVAVRMGEGQGLTEAAVAGLAWAGRVVARPAETSRRVVVACTSGGDSLRAAVGGAGVAVEAMIVGQFVLGDRVGVRVESIGT